MSPAADRHNGSGEKPTLIPESPEAVVRKGSGEQAAAYIRQLVFDGQLREGMRLPQDEVAKAVGVSRIPIREAIIALEREGWVTTRLHRGTFVNAFDEQVIRDHYELFGLVYGLAARRAAERSEPQLVERLSELSQLLNTTDDLRRIGELALAFHSTVVEAAHSASHHGRAACHVRARPRPVLRPGSERGRVGAQGVEGDRACDCQERRRPGCEGVRKDAQWSS